MKLGRIGEVAVVAEPADVGGVCLDRPWVVVGADQDREARLLESETQSAGAAEQVDRRSVPVRPGSHRLTADRSLGSGAPACRASRRTSPR